jgi:hypothetical protein
MEFSKILLIRVDAIPLCATPQLMQLPPQSISCFRSRKQHFVYLLLGLMLFCGVEAKAQSSLLGRVEAMFHDLFYDKTTVPATGAQTKEPTSQGALIAPQKSGQALVIARISDPSIPPTWATKLVQQFLAKASNPGIRFVTIEDLTGSAKEALQTKAGEGGMQSFSSNQQALQFAASQGIPAVVTLSIENLNVRPAQTAAGMFLGTARGTVSMVSNAEGARSNSGDYSAGARSFNEQQVNEKLLQDLAAGLASQVSAWQPPAAGDGIGAICEVHAKVDGLSMPSFVMTNGTPSFNNQSVPVFASGATVELDGILVGQTPCAIQAGRGMHELKVTREGLKPFAATINLTGQNRYDAVLVPSDETLAKFNQQLAYIRELDMTQKVNDAEIKVLEGYAKLLRQSGYRVDQRSVSDWGHLSVDREDAANKK